MGQRHVSLSGDTEKDSGSDPATDSGYLEKAVLVGQHDHVLADTEPLGFLSSAEVK